MIHYENVKSTQLQAQKLKIKLTMDEARKSVGVFHIFTELDRKMQQEKIERILTGERMSDQLSGEMEFSRCNNTFFLLFALFCLPAVD